ncbi:MAG: HDOD domain-containing protein [Syntrophobacteraceae bacterium]
MKKRILFVDDESKVLEGLQRMLRSTRHEWDVCFVASGVEALQNLGSGHFDVVVSDMRMPGMDGCDLLTRVRAQYPQIVRIILSGYADREVIMQSVRVAHQYLSKPCDPETLKATISRALALREYLSNEALLRVVSQIETLPSAPSVYQEVLDELSSPQASIHTLVRILSKDIAMTAKILHLANSAFFGFHHHVSSLERALALLGIETLLALVISVQVFSTHERAPSSRFSIATLWDHSMKTGALARAIAVSERQEPAQIENAFIAGFLHDVGILVLATSFPDDYSRIIKVEQEKNCLLREAELDVLGTSHAEVGAYLMGLWGLPDPIVEAIAFHHTPGRCMDRELSSLTTVHVANALTRRLWPSRTGQPPDLIDHDYLVGLNVHDRLAAWEAIARKLMVQG